MLQIKILAVGKIKENYLKEGIKEYCKRLKAYVKLEIIEVEDEPCPERTSKSEEEKIKQTEGERLLKYVFDKEYLILLDLKGKDISSTDIAKILEEKATKGISKFVFIIGGSLGISENVKQRANYCWALSKLTFPHQLIRLILLEQIYRACKINQGEPYHK